MRDYAVFRPTVRPSARGQESFDEEGPLSQSESLTGAAPVLPADIRVESVGVRAIDRRRVDVAVDLTPCRAAVNVEIVIVGPDERELCSTMLLANRQATLDRIMHLRQDAQPGRHTLYVGVFYEDELVARADRTFVFPLAKVD
jgi:hypothetical protein